ncbi:MAG: YIP1 family protein [Chloroflexi bacterium]|nr:YIP1 family protein [Chloroflexota bacterium]
MNDAPQGQLVNRMIRAARLDRELYAEVTADTTATQQATFAVIIAALAAAIGAFIGFQVEPPDPGTFATGDQEADDANFVWLIFTPILSVIAWLAWAGVAWFAGTRLISTDAQDVGFLQVARALGFAQAPGVLNVATFIPGLGVIVQIGVWLWALATSFFAIRESMRLANGQAIATMILGFIPAFIIGVVIGSVLLAGAYAGAAT